MIKRILFVTLHRPDRSPSQRFRFEQYTNFLNENGFVCSHSFLLDEKDDSFFYRQGKIGKKGIILIKSTVKRFKEILSNNYDIIFVQRECHMLGTSFFERRFSKKSKLIMDFDDSIWIHQTGELKSANKSLYFLKNPSKTKNIIKVANLVIAGNQYLKEYAQQFNNNVKIIPTTINTAQYRRIDIPQKNKDRICIGWSGSFSTIIHFEYAVEALKQLKQKYGDRIYFKVIGDATYTNAELVVNGIAWKKDTEVEDLSEIDIGIMPLPNDEWTKGKCGLKGLQYMALEIATIMAPVGVNNDIVKDGENGFLASSTDEWVEKISLMIEDCEKRKRIGQMGRKTVEELYSVNANKKRYLDYLNEVCSP